MLTFISHFYFSVIKIHRSQNKIKCFKYVHCTYDTNRIWLTIRFSENSFEIELSFIWFLKKLIELSLQSIYCLIKHKITFILSKLGIQIYTFKLSLAILVKNWVHFGDLKIPNLMGSYCTLDEEWAKACIGSLSLYIILLLLYFKSTAGSC